MVHTVIKATTIEEARYWFNENHDNAVITKIKRKNFSHIDQYDGKHVFNYWVYWHEYRRKRNEQRTCRTASKVN